MPLLPPTGVPARPSLPASSPLAVSRDASPDRLGSLWPLRPLAGSLTHPLCAFYVAPSCVCVYMSGMVFQMLVHVVLRTQILLKFLLAPTGCGVVVSALGILSNGLIHS